MKARTMRDANDFLACVRSEKREVLPSQAPLYAGIYRVRLGPVFDVMFVPFVEPTASNWPPHFPENIDALQTAEEAKLAVFANEDCIITPDPILSDTEVREEILPKDDWQGQPQKGLVYYLSPAHFAQITAELAALEDECSGLYDCPTFSRLAGTALAAFLEAHILNSPHYPKKQWLMRSK